VKPLVRVVAGVVAAFGLGVQALAGAAPPKEWPASDRPVPAAKAAAPRPTAVVLRIEGGFHPQNRWLWYDLDGTARSVGIVAMEHGRLRSRVDYANVERILAGAELCTRRPTFGRPVGNDMFYYRLSVRCGDAWRLFTAYDASDRTAEAAVRDAVRDLEHIAANLTWEPTNESIAPPDSRGPLRFTT